MGCQISSGGNHLSKPHNANEPAPEPPLILNTPSKQQLQQKQDAQQRKEDESPQPNVSRTHLNGAAFANTDADLNSDIAEQAAAAPVHTPREAPIAEEEAPVVMSSGPPVPPSPGGKVKKLKQRADVGAVAASLKNNLGKKLERRMSKLEFDKKFSHLQAGEASGSLVSRRGSKLGDLLSNRPSRTRLVAMNVLGTEEAEEQKQRKLNLLAKKLQARPDRQTLVHHNVLQAGGAASSLSGARAKMEAFQRKNKLSGMISARPRLNDLKNRGIFIIEEDEAGGEEGEEAEGEKEDEVKELGAKRGNKRRGGHRKSLSFEISKEALGPLLSKRATKEELSKRRILVTVQEEDSDEKKSSRKTTLDSFLLRRPNAAALRKQKLLTDIGVAAFGGEESGIQDQTVAAPRKVDALQGHKVTAVCAAWGHTTLLESKGDVLVFGNGQEGRLGLGETEVEARFTPAPIASLRAFGVVKSIACGDNHTVAVLASGDLYSWGVGSWGRLGHGSQANAFEPTKVDFSASGGDIKAVEAVCGSYHTLVRSSSNKLYGFGWNKNGRVGVGRELSAQSGDTITAPVGLAFLNSDDIRVVAMAAGVSVSLALDSEGRVYTWGAGVFGGLGHGDEKDVWEPRQVAGLSTVTVTKAACGSSHIIVSDENDVLYSWGNNKQGQLGRGTTTSADEVVPAQVALDAKAQGGVQLLACGKSHTAVVTKNGQLYTFGSATRGILGHSEGEDNVSTPTRVVGALADVKVVDVSCSWVHTAALSDDGALYTWGSQQYGKLGFA